MDQEDLFEVQFKADRKAIYYNASDSKIERDDYVIVEADRGEDLGFVSQKGHLIRFKSQKKRLERKSLKKILRPATEDDVDKLERNNSKEKEAFNTCKQKIVDHGLPMKLVDVEIQFDQSKITFYFTADQRVDFRELVKDLASVYRTRIELRQIGVRDEARRLGGCGICGLKQCCCSFIREFEQVTTHMARDQQLSLNPAKISGNCGRLLCCLRYELDFYHQMETTCPSPGKRVKTEKGMGVISHHNIFKETVSVKYESGGEEELPCKSCTLLEAGKDATNKEKQAK